MDLYRDEILEHWRSPQNFGEIKGADLVVDQINPLCGDRVRFYFKFATQVSSSRKRGSDGDSRSESRMTNKKNARIIKDVSFTGNGCAISIASASILSEFIKGKKISVLSKITGEDVLELVGGKKGFPPARLKCAFLPLEALRKIAKSK